MGQIAVPPAPSLKTASYSGLRGVDFSQDPSLVDRKRSPYALNLISDDGGNPVKRLGWRVIHQLEAPIHNMWRGEIDGKDKVIVHAGTKVYEITDNNAVEKATVGNTKGTGFFMRKGDDEGKNLKGYLWFTAGGKYYYYDGENVGLVKDIATRPKILISRNPDGGGVSFDEVNLLTGKKTVSFYGDDTSKEYKLPSENIDSVDEVRVMGEDGKFTALTSDNYTVDLEKGTVTFTAAHKPVNEGEDNVEIDYTDENEENVSFIENCTISAVYGYNASNRVFLSGNSEYRAYHWYSAIFDPTYFGDLDYAVVGAGETSVMGYAKIGEYLAIIKEDNQQDSTIFLCYGELDEEGKIQFSTKQGLAGIGAISKYCFTNLGDEPLFLSRLGVYAVTSTLLSSDRVAKNRSYFVDKKLTLEPNLEKAVAVEWNGYYLLAINGNVYVLDSRHSSGNRNTSDYTYEAYFWNNVPAVCFLSYGGLLYFGTEDGRVCKFNTDIDNMGKYCDGGTYNENLTYVEGGEAIKVVWSTPNDADDGVQYFKTLNKKGCLVVLSPYARSSCAAYFVVDGNPRELIRSDTFDIFDWSDIDFERITFNTNDSPQELYFNKKKKKYKRLQILLMNTTINEGFGIHEIIKTYSVGNFSKNRRV